MKVELKNVKIAHELSQETIAYSGELWINGKLAAYASNHGTGGCDLYRPANDEGRALIAQAGEWAKTQPAIRGQFGLLKMDFELLVGGLLEDEMIRQEYSSLFDDPTLIIYRKDGDEPGTFYTARFAGFTRPLNVAESMAFYREGYIVYNDIESLISDPHFRGQ